MLRRVLLLASSSMFLLWAAYPALGQQIFVSPDGNDANSGTSANSPLRTFQAGADRARALGAGTVVQFADGEYSFQQTAVLDTSHSGLTFQAAPGANPIFHSLQRVTGWSPDPSNGNIMVADLPSGISHVRYLQDQSESWLNRSAAPQFTTTELAHPTNTDFQCVECNNYREETQSNMSNIQYSVPNDPIDWSPARAAQYDLRASILPWHQEILPIAAYDQSAGRISTSVPGLYDLRDDPNERPAQAWVMNTREGIDTPGEWASLDGKIYLHPRSGTNDIFVPRLTELVRIDDGTMDGNQPINTPVQNITFEGLTFTGGDFRVMQHGEGANLANRDVTAQHDWAVVDEPDSLLRIRNAENITVRNSTFFKSGGGGIRVDRHAQNIEIIGNTMTQLGRGAITLTGRGPGHGDVNRDNEIAYNLIEQVGLEKWASVAILLDQSSNNHVHHNYIEDTRFTGIATVGPRQLAIAALAENLVEQGELLEFYQGREFHFAEWEAAVIEAAANSSDPIIVGSLEAMQHVYNYNNLIEENALIDVSTGTDFFLNGQIYNSGSKRSVDGNTIFQNAFERNYLFQTRNDVNDYAYYSDSDQDAAQVIGNMIMGLMNGDNQPEAAPIILAFNQWAESTDAPDMGLGLGEILLRANVTEDSTFCDGPECSHTIGIDFSEEGQVINGVGGDVAFLEIYRDMYRAIRDENFPQIDEIPGAQRMRDRLEAIITQFGGELPIAGDFNDDGAMNGTDIDALIAAIANESDDLLFDLNGDGTLDRGDRDVWLAEAGELNLSSGSTYLLADANLDGTVDVSDFNSWNNSKFTNTASWTAGDFNADGVVDASDFNIWNANKFLSSDQLATVPEPAALTQFLLAVIFMMVLRKR